MTLDEVFISYDAKFGALKQNKLHLLKALGYFTDAENETGLNMLMEISWDSVKKFFKHEVHRLSRQLLTNETQRGENIP